MTINRPDKVIMVTNPAATGEIANSAAVIADTCDPDSGNNTDDEITTLILWKIYIPLVLR
jgi:hypothetical protein